MAFYATDLYLDYIIVIITQNTSRYVTILLYQTVFGIYLGKVPWSTERILNSIVF